MRQLLINTWKISNGYSQLVTQLEGFYQRKIYHPGQQGWYYPLVYNIVNTLIQLGSIYHSNIKFERIGINNNWLEEVVYDSICDRDKIINEYNHFKVSEPEIYVW